MGSGCNLKNSIISAGKSLKQYNLGADHGVNADIQFDNSGNL